MREHLTSTMIKQGMSTIMKTLSHRGNNTEALTKTLESSIKGKDHTVLIQTTSMNIRKRGFVTSIIRGNSNASNGMTSIKRIKDLKMRLKL